MPNKLRRSVVSWLLALCWSAKLSRMRSAHSIPFSARHKGNFLTLPQLSKELWLQLSLFDHNSFITVFLWLGTLVSEYFILLPHGVLSLNVQKLSETSDKLFPAPTEGTWSWKQWGCVGNTFLCLLGQILQVTSRHPKFCSSPRTAAACLLSSTA